MESMKRGAWYGIFPLARFLGTGFSFLGTTAGSAMVYLFRDDMDARVHRVFLGFASGVMIAASFWSLLLPALDMAGDGLSALIPVAGGFAAGGIFLYLLDQLMPHLHAGADCPGGQTLFPGPLHLAGSGGNPPQHPRRHGGGPLLRPGSRRGFHRHHGRVHRLGHWHGCCKISQKGRLSPFPCAGRA